MVDVGKRSAVLEWLVLNSDYMRQRIGPLADLWMLDKPNYLGYEELFDGAYQQWLVGEVLTYVVPGFQLSYEDAHSILDFPTLRAIWKLDPKGYDV